MQNQNHTDFVRRIAEEQDIPVEQVKFGICTKQIRWDNCAGSIVTMSNVGEMVYLTQHSNGTHSAYYDYGDTIISDYLGVDEGVRIVTEDEALLADEEYRQEQRRRIAQSRAERGESFDDFDFGDREFEDALSDYD